MSQRERINVNTERGDGSQRRAAGQSGGQRQAQQTRRGAGEADAVLIEISETGRYFVFDWNTDEELAAGINFTIQGESGLIVEDPSPQAERKAQSRGNVAVAFVESNVADPLTVRDQPQDIIIDLRGVR